MKKIKKKLLIFTFISFLFIYFIHYPFASLFPSFYHMPEYDMSAWVYSYILIITTIPLFIISVHYGMKSDTYVNIYKFRWLEDNKNHNTFDVLSVIYIVTLFTLWSMLMLHLKIGITYYTDFEVLPFRLVGILFYGRLILQPILLGVIAKKYNGTRYKYFIFIIFYILGGVATVSSGSRFIGLVFSLPILLLFSRNKSYIIFLCVLYTYIIFAQLSRIYFLPFYLNDPYLIFTQGNADSMSNNSDGLAILFIPISYFIVRILGIKELLATLSYGETTPTLVDSLFVFLSNYIPYLHLGKSKAAIDILQDINAGGGVALDPFSTIWLNSGGIIVLYYFSVVFLCIIFGRTFAYACKVTYFFGISVVDTIFYIIIFILFFVEGRLQLLMPAFLIGWVLSRNKTLYLISKIIDSTKSIKYLYIHITKVIKIVKIKETS